MWRKVDLHNHTFPNEKLERAWDVEVFIQSALDVGLEVIAITDHDVCSERFEETMDAAGDRLTVLPGVEISTDRGHILVISVGTEGATRVRAFCARLAVKPESQVKLDSLIELLDCDDHDGELFKNHMLVIAAHADLDGHLLGAKSSLSVKRQVEYASRMAAIEVCRDEVFTNWAAGGVKQTVALPLVRGSDNHNPDERRDVSQYVYLPEIELESFYHAFAVPESSIAYEQPVRESRYLVRSVEISDGLHGGQRFEFCERSNAIIGPPNSGKSLLIDCIKFAFGVKCKIRDVENLSQQRFEACVPPGTTVTVQISHGSTRQSVARVVGASSVDEPLFVPIIFSQTELVRRAHQAEPDIQLLDIHCEDLHSCLGSLDESTRRVRTRFAELVEIASDIAQLSDALDNREDGLRATESALNELTGAEAVAGRSADIARVGHWLSRASNEVDGFDSGSSLPAIDLDPVPDGLPDDLRGLLCDKRIGEAVNAFHAQMLEIRSKLSQAMRQAIESSQQQFDEIKSDNDQELADAGFAKGAEVTEALERLRERLAVHKSNESRRRALQGELQVGLGELKAFVDETEQARKQVTEQRKMTTKKVNQSMPTFFSVVRPEADTTELDALFDEVKKGTKLWESTVRSVSSELDRYQLLEDAISIVVDPDVDRDETTISNREKIIREAISRNKIQTLALIATTWGDDGLDLRLMPSNGGQPTAFSSLTEGLRALAVKEISFAASDLPVITDQPEDAVPTKLIYESLVPIIRSQRGQRQFLMVSHDANTVVASDVERVISISPSTGAPPVVGSLFDPDIRHLALEHLEGGAEAFERRSKHYSRTAS